MLSAFISLTFFCDSSKSASLPANFNIGNATANDTIVAAATPANTGRYPPFGHIASIAIILPGDAGAVNPAPNILFTNTPVAPPAIAANIKTGFINIYGKYISCIPPKKCITTAPGAELFADPLPAKQYARSIPRPGPGFASSRKNIDLPTSSTCCIPIGENIP